MPPRKKTAAAKPSALSDDEVAGLRARVSAGEKPRVIVRAASAAVPAGTRGNVIRMGNPSEGEFIVVRLGRDEVPFAPSELGLSARGKASTASVTPAAKKSAAKKATAKTGGAARPAAAAARKAAPRKSTATAQPPRPVRPAAATRRRAATKAGTRRGAHPLTVTLRFTDGAWTVEAQRGTRRLAKASAVRPGAVKAFADLVDEPVVREALTETVDSCRAVVEERAEKLRAELQAAEASLKEYEARRR